MPATIDRSDTAATRAATSIPDHPYRPGSWAGPSYRLAAPAALRVVIEHVDECVVVREVVVGIYGAGPNVRAAFADFQNAVAQHLEVLERQEELSEDLQHQLKYLRARRR